MTHDAVTLVFYVDGRGRAERALHARAFAVPRQGDLVQLGPYGGPYEWRRVIEVTWRHEPTLRGGVSAAVLLEAEAVGEAAREGRDASAAEGPRAEPPRAKKKDDERQQRLPAGDQP